MRPGYTELCETDHTKFRSWSASDVYTAVDVIAAAAQRYENGTMSKAMFDELQQAYGLNWHCHGLLSNKELRPFLDPVQAMTWDWVHNMLQHGVLTHEVSLLLAACKSVGVMRSDVELFLQDTSWQFCHVHKTKCSQLHRVFSHWRASGENADKLNVSASELLSLYGMVRHFVETRVPATAELADKLASFSACCRTVDAIMSCKRGMVSPAATAARLRDLSCDHLGLHIRAYGTASVKPKHHWNIDVADQLLRDGVVVDMFIVERNHLTVKRVADHVKRLTRFERSVLSRLLAEATTPKSAEGCPHRLHGRVVQVNSTTWTSDRMVSYGLEAPVDLHIKLHCWYDAKPSRHQHCGLT